MAFQKLILLPDLNGHPSGAIMGETHSAALYSAHDTGTADGSIVARCAGGSIDVACCDTSRSDAPGPSGSTGVWTYTTLTPLERPATFTGKPFLTDEEAAAFLEERRRARDFDRRGNTPEADFFIGTAAVQ